MKYKNIILLKQVKKQKYHKRNIKYKQETKITELKVTITKINFHYSYLLETLACTIRQEKERSTQIGKREIILPLFADYMT